MRFFLTKGAWACALLALSTPCVLAAPQPNAATTIEHVKVLGAGSGLELEISTSQPVTPQAQMVTGPDRLVLDFRNASPGAALRNLSVNRGEVKAVRVGVFSTHPLTTRLVVDLKTPQSYQLFPSGKTVIVKLGGSQPAVASAPAPAAATASVVIERYPVKPAPRVEVSFTAGKLSIWADRATLAEVLYEVHRKTGASIPIPAGAEQEQVVVQSGPGPARDVLAALLNGSRFDFVMVGSDRDAAQLRSVILTPRGASGPAVVYTGRTEPVAQVAPAPMPEPGPAPEAPEPPPGSAPEANDQPEPSDTPQ